MMTAVLRLCHAAAHRLEDFGAAQFWNQEPEDVPAGDRVRFHVAAGSGASLDYAGKLELSQRAVHRRSRRAEGLH